MPVPLRRVTWIRHRPGGRVEDTSLKRKRRISLPHLRLRFRLVFRGESRQRYTDHEKDTWVFVVVPDSGPAAPTQATKITVITHPRLPSRENLKRMSLDLGWDLKVPMADNTDRIFSIQVSPWYDARKRYNPQLIVQTESGQLFLLDAENGEIIWAARLDPAKCFPSRQLARPLRFRNGTLFVFDRITGMQQLFWYDIKKVKHYGMALKSDGPAAISGRRSLPPIATPSADEESLFYTTGDSIISFSVPNYPELAEYARASGQQSRREFSTDRRPNPTFPRVLTNHVCDGSIIWASHRGHVPGRHAAASRRRCHRWAFPVAGKEPGGRTLSLQRQVPRDRGRWPAMRRPTAKSSTSARMNRCCMPSI